MGLIILEGWKVGLEKVTLTKLQMNLLKIPLVDSKSNVDKLLDGEVIIIKESEDTLARLFIRKATEIGVICYYLDSMINRKE